MGVLMLAAAGGALGYLASLLLFDGRYSLLNVVVGMLGSMMTTLLLTPYFGMPVVFGGDISLASFFSSLIGAVAGLGLLNLSLIRSRKA